MLELDLVAAFTCSLGEAAIPKTASLVPTRRTA
jgi:hypothetical protein